MSVLHHEIRATHFDVKPDNILLDHNGHLVLADFSLSLPIEDDGSVKNARVCGTMGYQAPEMLVQQVTSIDAKADIWSLGVVLLQLAAYMLGQQNETSVRRKSCSPLQNWHAIGVRRGVRGISSSELSLYCCWSRDACDQHGISGMDCGEQVKLTCSGALIESTCEIARGLVGV